MNRTLLLFVLLSIIFTVVAEDITRTISVVGRGEMSLKPDTVVISTGVDSADPIIGKALEENNRIMAQIFEGLSDIGISEEQIRTDNYNVYFYKPYNDEDTNREEYRVSNSIRINIKKIELADVVIDTLITLGANKINGINFTIEDEDAYSNILREKAVKNARDKAEFLAELEGMHIINVISISEQRSSNAGYARNYDYAVADSVGKSSISSGMEKLSVSFDVIYQIEPKWFLTHFFLYLL